MVADWNKRPMPPPDSRAAGMGETVGRWRISARLVSTWNVHRVLRGGLAAVVSCARWLAGSLHPGDRIAAFRRATDRLAGSTWVVADHGNSRDRLLLLFCVADDRGRS